MEDKPHSFIMFVITLVLSVIAMTGMCIAITIHASIDIVAAFVITQFISVLISPVGLIVGLKLKTWTPKEKRYNKIGTIGNGVFTVVLLGMVVYFVFLA